MVRDACWVQGPRRVPLLPWAAVWVWGGQDVAGLTHAPSLLFPESGPKAGVGGPHLPRRRPGHIPTLSQKCSSGDPETSSPWERGLPSEHPVGALTGRSREVEPPLLRVPQGSDLLPKSWRWEGAHSRCPGINDFLRGLGKLCRWRGDPAHIWGSSLQCPAPPPARHTCPCRRHRCVISAVL